jgi:hypothetical protein
MSDKNNNYGVLTEQGFPISGGLGFKPLTETDKKILDESSAHYNKVNNEKNDNNGED